MSSRQEVKATRHRLQGAIARSQQLAQRCASQVADGDLRYVDRESAEKRFWLTIKTSNELETQLERIDEALR